MKYTEQKILWVHHWNDGLFSFGVDRPNTFRFDAGQFVMIGLYGDDSKPILRAYSVASPPWAEELEFLSIKVANGPLTSRLQHITAGDMILLGSKPTGTLVYHALAPGRRLFLLGTGTGLAPWLSIARDIEAYDRFEEIVVCHGVRYVNELCYHDLLKTELYKDPILGEYIDGKFRYFPTVTRESFHQQGRLTTMIETGELFERLGLQQASFNPETDRVMVCGNEALNIDIHRLMLAQGMVEGSTHHPGHWVYEKSFVEKDNRPASGSFPTFASLSARAEANFGNIRTTRYYIVSRGFYNFDIRTHLCRKRDSNVKINPLVEKPDNPEATCPASGSLHGKLKGLRD